MSRTFTSVFRQVMQLIPDNAEWKDTRVAIVTRLMYAAPEIKWIEFVRVLTEHLPEPHQPDSPEWANRISDVMENRQQDPNPKDEDGKSSGSDESRVEEVSEENESGQSSVSVDRSPPREEP